MNLVDELHAIAKALDEAGVRYAVCGGVAVTIHGATRSTKDIDILVAPDDLQRALDTVRPLGYVFVALPMTFEEGSPRERHVQRVSKISGGEHLVLDLLLEQAAFSNLLAGSISVTLPAGPLVVVARHVLLHMKRLASRPQDLADIEKLEESGD
jgi:hypothetical protein